ncbi:hypothetical protein [Pseudomonas sp. CNPSo 3701]|uniref:hypothetical protein n=1 Tax=Pseudomonas sp. CNPSo 3701 TaxID=3027943 RepID=UPI002363DE37|nr:hypothetical protein [Pseudomonas sp. CNPSo 3701]MDD1507593.1 hypothetical protein [Pseudomonas sp. CNPSo 3701]
MDALITFLTSIPATAWSALASAILTSTIAFLGISYSDKENLKRMKSQHEHERQLRKDEILRERAEELYVAVKKFCSAMISDHFP